MDVSRNPGCRLFDFASRDHGAALCRIGGRVAGPAAECSGKSSRARGSSFWKTAHSLPGHFATIEARNVESVLRFPGTGL
jgi:hypothetical protein